jgi:hypothetical protein
MYCPKCRVEYRAGFTECSDCRVRLVAELPPPAEAPGKDSRADTEVDDADPREELQNNPFDPRTEISADARHIASKIVIHLWILFVLLPIIVVAFLALVRNG